MISDKSTVETKFIGKNVEIHEYCVIRSNVRIANNVIIHPHVTIYGGVEIGNNVEIFTGAVLGKKPSAPDILSRQIEYSEIVKIGDNSSIGPNTIIYYDVEIGEDCLIGDAVAIREKSKIGNRCILGRHVSLNYNVIIGDESIIMSNSHLTGNTKVGKKVFISVGVCTANDNHFGDLGYDESFVLGPTIEDRAKIGEGAIILPKIRIGENSLISAGSVVTRDVEKNSQVMGIPAKHIRYIGSNK